MVEQYNGIISTPRIIDAKAGYTS